MANKLIKIINQEKYNQDCKCPLEVRYTLQRNDQSFEGETRFEPTDNAVYKIVVTNKGPGYAKDVKAFTWLTASVPPAETIDIPDNLRIIPHGLLGKFKLEQSSLEGTIMFPDGLEPVSDDLDFYVFRENAEKRNIPFPSNVEDLIFHCNVVRFGDIDAGETKVACLTIISEGAPENTEYNINLFFKFDCCEIIPVPIPQCRQIEFGVIEGQIVRED
jgi:hypothetical protein